jgi:hypothetical protein
MRDCSGNSGPTLSFPPHNQSLIPHKRPLLLALILHIIHFLDHVQIFTFGHESLSKTPLQFKGKVWGGGEGVY